MAGATPLPGERIHIKADFLPANDPKIIAAAKGLKDNKNLALKKLRYNTESAARLQFHSLLNSEQMVAAIGISDSSDKTASPKKLALRFFEWLNKVAVWLDWKYISVGEMFPGTNYPLKIFLNIDSFKERILKVDGDPAETQKLNDAFDQQILEFREVKKQVKRELKEGKPVADAEIKLTKAQNKLNEWINATTTPKPLVKAPADQLAQPSPANLLADPHPSVLIPPPPIPAGQPLAASDLRISLEGQKLQEHQANFNQMWEVLEAYIAKEDFYTEKDITKDQYFEFLRQNTGNIQDAFLKQCERDSIRPGSKTEREAFFSTLRKIPEQQQPDLNMGRIRLHLFGDGTTTSVKTRGGKIENRTNTGALGFLERNYLWQANAVSLPQAPAVKPTMQGQFAPAGAAPVAPAPSPAATVRNLQLKSLVDDCISSLLNQRLISNYIVLDEDIRAVHECLIGQIDGFNKDPKKFVNVIESTLRDYITKNPLTRIGNLYNDTKWQYATGQALPTGGENPLEGDHPPTPLGDLGKDYALRKTANLSCYDWDSDHLPLGCNITLADGRVIRTGTSNGLLDKYLYWFDADKNTQKLRGSAITQHNVPLTSHNIDENGPYGFLLNGYNFTLRDYNMFRAHIEMMTNPGTERDFLPLQEISPAMISALQRGLGEDYQVVEVPAHLRNDKEDYGAVIVNLKRYKPVPFPPKHIKVGKFDAKNPNKYINDILLERLDGGFMRSINTHTQYGPTGLKCLTDYLTKKDNQPEIGVPICLAGDFNAPMENVLAALKEAFKHDETIHITSTATNKLNAHVTGGNQLGNYDAVFIIEKVAPGTTPTVKGAVSTTKPEDLFPQSKNAESNFQKLTRTYAYLHEKHQAALAGPGAPPSILHPPLKSEKFDNLRGFLSPFPSLNTAKVQTILTELEKNYDFYNQTQIAQFFFETLRKRDPNLHSTLTSSTPKEESVIAHVMHSCVQNDIAQLVQQGLEAAVKNLPPDEQASYKQRVQIETLGILEMVRQQKWISPAHSLKLFDHYLLQELNSQNPNRQADAKVLLVFWEAAQKEREILETYTLKA